MFWLVVLTILKNISQWEGLSHILWKINIYITWLQPPTSVFTHSNTKLDLPGAHSATMIFPHRHCPVARTARGRGGKVPSASWSRWVEGKIYIQYMLLVSSPPQNVEMSFSMHIYIYIHNTCVCLLNLLTIEHIKTKPLDYWHLTTIFLIGTLKDHSMLSQAGMALEVVHKTWGRSSPLSSKFGKLSFVSSDKIEPTTTLVLYNALEDLTGYKRNQSLNDIRCHVSVSWWPGWS